MLQEVSENPAQPMRGSGEGAPRDLHAFEFSPGKKLAHFVIALQDIPGAFETSAAIATKHHVNILSGFHCAPSGSSQGFWSFFADFTDADIDPKGLAQELQFLPSSADVRFKVPQRGLLIDSFHFPIQLGGRRAMIMRTGSFASMFTRIIGMFGDGAAARVVIYQMGEAAGRAMMKELVDELGAALVREELRSIIGLYSSYGWGVFNLVSLDLDKIRAEIRARDNFECSNFDKSTVPRSNFVRGHIAGWFSELVGSRVEVAEEYCVSKGDPFCYFVAQHPHSDKV